MGDVVAPVKALLKAVDAGIKVAGRLITSASNVPTAQALQISEAATKLQKGLERSSQAIGEAYRQHVATCGDPFTKALVEDKAIEKQLKRLKNEVRDRIDDIEEDPESFDPITCLEAQDEAEKCCTTCLNIFGGLGDRVKAEAPVPQRPDDRAQLTSMRVERSPSLRKPLPTPPQQSPNAAEPLQILTTSMDIAPEPSKARNPWAIESPSQFHLGAPMASSQSSHQRRHSSRDLSPKALPPVDTPKLISREIVRFRVDANEDFLEKRRQSRLFFQNEIRKSVSSIEEDKPSETFTDGPLIVSPILGSSGMATSPVDGRGSRGSLNNYGALMTRQRSQGQASQGTRSSRTSSILQDRQPERQLAQRQDSQDSIFGLRAAPLSPPLSEHRISGGTDTWGTLATTLQTPDFGKGVEPGLEVVSNVDYGNEKIAVGPDEFHQPTPTASLKTVEYPIRHDTSFYRFGGFCEGSRAIMRGENGMKLVKRPSGHYSALISARCTKCSYEVGWNDVEKDRVLDPAGIYGNSGIRWRQTFISKCHLKTNSVEEPIYACIFCIDEHKTIEEHDATVFFSVPQLFRHLSKHPRPLPVIAGITILYGFQPPGVVDFDIHFTTPQSSTSQYSISEIAQKVATRPSAHASSTHHPKNTRSNSRDPEGNPVLKFASGARIVGITFPERFGGKWCMGYHDGERGAFPASEITLEMPAKEDVLMNPQSTLVATARWDFKPKDTKDNGWLKFSRGDRISCIGYTFQDQWCWSGHTGKGKWGLFPAAFVENLQDGKGELSSSVGSATSRSFGLGSRMPSFPLGRNKSSRMSVGMSEGARGSAASVRSNGSGGSPAGKQAGLEVVQSLFTGGMIR